MKGDIISVDRIIDFFQNAKVFFTTYVIDTLKTIGVKDVIDILILAIILFFIYRLIRQRRAGKLLIGVALFLLISFIANIFDMNALKFVFRDFNQIGLLAILILFQPELRSALEKIGGTPISSLKSIADSKDLAVVNSGIDAICSAASDLSRDKIGALIVIERTTKLGEYAKSGVYIDSALSPHLLKNIFFNKAPLHDGAVIIKNSRIDAAGCFLPLSTKEDINKDLGTRHRAAIGLTEMSDAIVIVVSEETGMISVSIDGDLKRNFNYNTLKQLLNNMLSPSIDADASKKRKKSKR